MTSIVRGTMPASSTLTSIRDASRLCVPQPCRVLARIRRPTRLISALRIQPSQRRVSVVCMATAIWCLPSVSARLHSTTDIWTKPSKNRDWNPRWMLSNCICCPNTVPTTRLVGRTRHARWADASCPSLTRRLPSRRRVHRQSWLPSTIPTRKRQR